MRSCRRTIRHAKSSELNIQVVLITNKTYSIYRRHSLIITVMHYRVLRTLNLSLITEFVFKIAIHGKHNVMLSLSSRELNKAYIANHACSYMHRLHERGFPHAMDACVHVNKLN